MQQIPVQDFIRVELFISCRSLKNKDTFSKSDPFVIFYMRNQQGQYYQYGKTEVIKDNLNPNFIQSFQVDYIFEQRQDCKFEIRDSDGKSSELIGSVETTIGAIVGAQKSVLILDLHCFKTQKIQGKVILKSEPVQDCNDVIFMKWSGIKLKNVDGWFDKSDPFLRFQRLGNDNQYTKVYETEVIMNNLNPMWKGFEIKAQKLCNGNYDRQIKIECWDWEKSQKFQYIGECVSTVNQFQQGQKEFIIKEPKKNKQTGTLKLEQFNLQKRPSFLDYIKGGVQLNLICAIDYTGSNGIPSQPSSLHYINPNQMNQYQQAIWSVGEILLNYDYDKRIPAYGFGAKTRYPNLSSPTPLHCFPISGDVNKPEAAGLQELMQLYSYSLQNVELSGPTYFNPIIQEVMKIAAQCQQGGSLVYSILLILTDGAIHDMQQVIDSIILAAKLPLSIIIVGVGNEDFKSMEILDGDNGLTSSKNEKCSRDLVQFVPFVNFANNIPELAKRVLGELPDQLVKYYTSVGIKPNPPPQVNMTQIQ